MDALLFVHRTVGAVGYAGPGELFVDPIGRARLRRGNQVAPYAYAGQYFPPFAWRKDRLEGVIGMVNPVYWNMKKLSA